MATIIQFRRDTAANWLAADPVLEQGELGLELVTNNFKIGNGSTKWSLLPYAITNIKGDTGATGTGLSRTTSTTIDFGQEKNYVEKVIADALIASDSVVIVQPLGEEFAIQGVSAGLVSITAGVGYTIFASAKDNASGIMSIKILIF